MDKILHLDHVDQSDPVPGKNGVFEASYLLHVLLLKNILSYKSSFLYH